MISYSLTNTVNDLSDNITNSYICNGFVKNPIIAGMVVSFITIFIIYISRTKNLTKLFIICSLCNIIYLFFHVHALKQTIDNKQRTNNLLEEFTGIKTTVSNNSEDEFSPPKED